MHIFLLLTSGILSQRCFTVHIAKAGDNFISPCATSLHRFPLFLVSRRSYCDASCEISFYQIRYQITIRFIFINI